MVDFIANLQGLAFSFAEPEDALEDLSGCLVQVQSGKDCDAGKVVPKKQQKLIKRQAARVAHQKAKEKLSQFDRSTCFSHNRLKILQFGTIISDRSSFHDKTHLWPVGFKASYSDSESYVTYTCEIVDGMPEVQDVPGFKIILKCSQNLREVTRRTAAEAWKAALILLLHEGNEVEKKAAQYALEMDPHLERRFGVDLNEVRELLEGLEGALECSKYFFLREKEIEKELSHSKPKKRKQHRNVDDENEPPGKKKFDHPGNSSATCSSNHKVLEDGLLEMYTNEGPFSPSKSVVEWKYLDSPVNGALRLFASEFSKIMCCVHLRSDKKTITSGCHKNALARMLNVIQRNGELPISPWNAIAETGCVICEVHVLKAGRYTLAVESVLGARVGKELEFVAYPLMTLSISNSTGEVRHPSLELGDAFELRCLVRDKNQIDGLGHAVVKSLLQDMKEDIKTGLQIPQSIDMQIESTEDVPAFYSWDICEMDNSIGLQCQRAETASFAELGVRNVTCSFSGILHTKEFDNTMSVACEYVSTPFSVHALEVTKFQLFSGSNDWNGVFEVRNQFNYPAFCTVEYAALIQESSDVTNSNKGDDSCSVSVTSDFEKMELRCKTSQHNSQFEFELCHPVPHTARNRSYILIITVLCNKGTQKKYNISCKETVFVVCRSHDAQHWNCTDVCDFVIEMLPENCGVQLVRHSVSSYFHEGTCMVEAGERWTLEICAADDDKYPWFRITHGVWHEYLQCVKLRHFLEGSVQRVAFLQASAADDCRRLRISESQADYPLEIGIHTFDLVICRDGKEEPRLIDSIDVLVVATPKSVSVVHPPAGPPQKVHIATRTWSCTAVLKNEYGINAVCEKIEARFVLDRFSSFRGEVLESNETIAVSVHPADGEAVLFALREQVPSNIRGTYKLEIDVKIWDTYSTTMRTNVSFDAIFSSDPQRWDSHDVVDFVRTQGISTHLKTFVWKVDGENHEVNGVEFVDNCRDHLRDWLSWSNTTRDQVAKIKEVEKNAKNLLEVAKCLQGEYSQYYGQAVFLSEFDPAPSPSTKLGEGASANVFKAKWVRNEQDVALKMFKCSLQDVSCILLTISKEVKQMRKFRMCPNVVYCYKMVMGFEQVGIVMELAETDLAKLIKSWKGTENEWAKETWDQCVGRLLGAAKGLLQLHQYNTLHGDVKSQNILICGPNTKIADLGQVQIDGSIISSHPIAASSMRTFQNYITWQFSAPEAYFNRMSSEKVRLKSDSWSFAAVALHTATRRMPFEGQKFDQYMIEYQHPSQESRSLDRKLSLHDTTGKDCPTTILEICKLCSDVDPQKRLSFDAITEKLEQALRPIQKTEMLYGFFSQDHKGNIQVQMEAENLNFFLEVKAKCSHFNLVTFPRPSLERFKLSIAEAHQKRVFSLLFSGHGYEKKGFVFCDSVIEPFEEIASVLRKHVETGKKTIECVFLNACETEELGNQLFRIGITYVICWTSLVADRKALDFSVDFYTALAETFPRDYFRAFREAKTRMESKHGHLQGLPKLLSDSGARLSEDLLLKYDHSFEQETLGDNDLGSQRSWRSPEDGQDLDLSALAGVEERNTLRSLNYPMVLNGKEIAVGNGINKMGKLDQDARRVMKISSFSQLWGSSGQVFKHVTDPQNKVTKCMLLEAINFLQKAIDFRKSHQQRFTACPKGKEAFKRLDGNKGCTCKYCSHAWMIYIMELCLSELQDHLATMSSKDVTEHRGLGEDCAMLDSPFSGSF